MERVDVEQRLLRRFPDLPVGVVVAAVGWVARRHLRNPASTPSREQVQLVADEQLLLRKTLRLLRGGKEVLPLPTPPR